MTRYGFLSTYPPTRCGLATFTEALAGVIARGEPEESRIVRVLDDLTPIVTATTAPGARIIGTLFPENRRSSAEAARALSAGDIAIVQHEYGIYGGVDGRDVLDVLDALRVPCIVVLHTVLDSPTVGQRTVLEQVAAQASAIVVMTQAAHDLLATRYSVPMRRVSVIPHGVPEWTHTSPVAPAEHPTIVTWGLIGPGKGIEWGIRAMAELADLDPRPRYLVAGQTHPKVLAQFGDVYRDGLHQLIADLDLTDRVTLDASYLGTPELAAFVQSADVVLLPYDSRNQVTSGVLVEAIAAGKHVVATGFPHAVELLDRDTGTIVAHEDPHAIATGLRAAITGLRAPRTDLVPVPKSALGWSEVAAQYRELATHLLAERAA
jgi:glycosyltransferase involved in cell wall biosynthesis